MCEKAQILLWMTEKHVASIFLIFLENNEVLQ